MSTPSPAGPSSGAGGTGSEDSVRRRPRALGAAAVIGVVGIGLVAYALTQGGTPPPQAEPNLVTASSMASGTTGSPSPTGTGPSTAPRPGLAASVPVSLAIPSIGVKSALLALGLTNDGHMQVPWKPLQAGWYKYGVTPGEIGPAVIAGHVDSAETGPAVFYDLAKIKLGALVIVTRKDGSTVRFEVQRIRVYPKDKFPTGAVYSMTTGAQLRLITCSGWDPTIRHYVDNTVVYLSMVA
jgi:hypothetical protein